MQQWNRYVRLGKAEAKNRNDGNGREKLGQRDERFCYDVQKNIKKGRKRHGIWIRKHVQNESEINFHG